MTPAALELSDVAKDYRALRPLRIERLVVAAGERVAIVGFDQAAAEVFVNLVTGATLADRGDVRAFGRSTRAIGDSAEWLAHVDRFGIVSERAVLLDSMTVTQNLAIPFTLDIEPPPDEIRDRAVALAREMGLVDADLGRPIAALGAASRLRVRLGRALALEPDVLLLEHPTVGLEPREVSPLGAQIGSIVQRRGAAMVAMTADGTFAAAVAARVLTWEPSTGRLLERRRRGWFGPRLG